MLRRQNHALIPWNKIVVTHYQIATPKYKSKIVHGANQMRLDNKTVAYALQQRKF